MSLSKHLAPKPSSLKIGEKIVSCGGNETVHQGELNGRAVAIKKIQRVLLAAVRDGQGDELLTAFKSGCERLESFNNPHIVGFMGAFYDQDSGQPILVMEKMQQDLSQLLRTEKGTLTYHRQFQLCFDVAKGLHFLHMQDPPFVPRYLTAKNVLLDESGRAKIGDLWQLKLNILQPAAVLYMPPEALATQPCYNENVDIFSYGVLMLEIATQQEPNPGLQHIGDVPEENRRQADLACLPPNHPMRPLILKCFNDTPEQRPNAAALIEELKKMNPVSPSRITCYFNDISACCNAISSHEIVAHTCIHNACEVEEQCGTATKPHRNSFCTRPAYENDAMSLIVQDTKCIMPETSILLSKALLSIPLTENHPENAEQCIYAILYT